MGRDPRSRRPTRTLCGIAASRSKRRSPDGVALVTAGVDVQADRLEMEIVGWGRDEESWSIAYHVIPGDVTRNEVWDHLEGLLLSEYLHDSGLPLRIVATCIDCGFKDATVLRFTRDRYNRRVYATKGRAGESPIWPRKPSRKNQTPFFMIGVDAAKTALYDRLKIGSRGRVIATFPIGRDLEYFEQLTAEKKFTRYHNGFPKQEWRKPANARNEALDCRELRLRGAARAVRKRIEADRPLRPLRPDGACAAKGCPVSCAPGCDQPRVHRGQLRAVQDAPAHWPDSITRTREPISRAGTEYRHLPTLIRAYRGTRGQATAAMANGSGGSGSNRPRSASKSSPTNFGRIFSAEPAREMQFGIKFLFEGDTMISPFILP